MLCVDASISAVSHPLNLDSILYPCALFIRSQCVPLQVNGAYLYAKVGCMDRETFTSTKLQLHVYTDQQCSQQYKDGQSARKHATSGYQVGSYHISSKVSFKPEFYSCLTCVPEQISQTFNKLNSNWYDDDYVSAYGSQQSKNNNRLLVEVTGSATNEVLPVSDECNFESLS
jgi:hypothetical protein